MTEGRAEDFDRRAAAASADAEQREQAARQLETDRTVRETAIEVEVRAAVTQMQIDVISALARNGVRPTHPAMEVTDNNEPPRPSGLFRRKPRAPQPETRDVWSARVSFHGPPFRIALDETGRAVHEPKWGESRVYVARYPQFYGHIDHLPDPNDARGAVGIAGDDLRTPYLAYTYLPGGVNSSWTWVTAPLRELLVKFIDDVGQHGSAGS